MLHCPCCHAWWERALLADHLLPGPQHATQAIILLTRPCGTDPLLGLFVVPAWQPAGELAYQGATERETGAAAPQLKSQTVAETTPNFSRVVPHETNRTVCNICPCFLYVCVVPVFTYPHLPPLGTIPLAQEAQPFLDRVLKLKRFWTRDLLKRWVSCVGLKQTVAMGFLWAFISP